MAKLHQILAIETGIRQQSQKDLTQAHHGLKKAELLTGTFREYQSLKDDGVKLPSERKSLSVRVPDVIAQTKEILRKSFDIVAVRDWANCGARSDVTLPDGTVILKNAPAPYLLWLEKQLADLHTFVCGLPTLPADMEWEWDANQNCYKNRYEVRTAKTEKVQEPLVLYPATPEHPAQTQMITRDVIAGYWTTTTYSGALPLPKVKELKERAETLLQAVKVARERANQAECEDLKVGAPLLNYIFDGKA